MCDTWYYTYIMRIFKYRPFNRWAKDLKLDDLVLSKMIRELEKGLYNANLGGGVYKKRIAIGKRGKRDGIRTIVAFKAADRAIFMYGYAKNEKSNISELEKEALKKLAKAYFSYSENQLYKAVEHNELVEIII